MGATDRASSIKANSALDVAISPLLRLQEAYPNLKSNEQFTRPSTTSLPEPKTASPSPASATTARSRITTSTYSSFPNSIWANMAGFHFRDEYFKGNPDNGTAPKVDFNK